MRQLFGAVIVTMLARHAGVRADEPVRFNRDIRPILSDNCFACHGPDANKRAARLRLDLRYETTKPALSGDTPVVAMHPNKSELIDRIFSDSADIVMPPPKSNRSLTLQQKELLKQWIAQGAHYEAHWAFVPPRRPETPSVKSVEWPRNAIDRFLLARMEEKGLRPAPEAEPLTLLRRVTLDLTGLPPTLAEASAFSNDAEPGAYERVVDRLMTTRAYAERRAQDWLDLARYADTTGFAADMVRDIWPYRDWVIDALDRNMPFDQFTIEQLAGDMLPGATNAQRIATAFHRNAPQAKGNTYPVEEYRLKGVVDRVNTTGTVWFGLTFACVECHDHKFDPITQVDYYRVAALFNNIVHTGQAFAQGGPRLTLNVGEKQKVQIPVMEELPQPRETFVHLRGNFLARGEKVSPGVPAIFGLDAAEQPKNRLDFARALVNGRNPLVARVAVNRFWQDHFQHGLVRTPMDFGLQGEWPTHPELLDWLACEFVESGWDMKAMHRLMVTSSAYRQASKIVPSLADRDPANRWLSRMPRVRLPAEQIRDQALAAAGLLRSSNGGRAVFPRQPANYWEQRALPGKWTDSVGDDRYRRSLYTYWRRMALHPTLELLDAPARTVCTVQRTNANVPTQALVTLNDPIFVEAAAAMATRVFRETTSDSARLDLAFRLCLNRLPDADERLRFLEFLHVQTRRYAADEAAARASTGTPDSALAAWTLVASVLLNLDESLTRP